MFKRTAYTILCTALLLLTGFSAVAQAGFFVPKQGKVFFATDTATIFSNVLNQGSLGVSGSAVLQFKGQVWENDPQSQITDATNGGLGVSGLGGVIRFSAANARQKLTGGYNAATRTGPMFSNLIFDNPQGVELYGSSTKVWQEVLFSNGVVFLNDNIFVVGHNQPGSIRGYDSSRYFVTGTQSNGGILLRENITSADGKIVFPVGTRAHAYTPAALQTQSSRGDNFYVTVFDGVRSRMASGSDLANESVNKTWQIGKMLRPGEDEVDLYLQHQNSDEGNLFALNRKNSYISQYGRNNWEVGYPQRLPSPGNLISGVPLANSSVNFRTLHASLSTGSYFTKFGGDGDTSGVTQLQLGAFRENSSTVRVNWQTKPEFDVKYFVVERRLSREGGFTPVATVNSKARNGVSFAYLMYGTGDPNSDRGVSFYRIRLVSYSNTSSYSNIVAVSGVGFERIILWPNPTADRFYLIVNSPEARSIVIYNTLGQKMWSTPINVNAQTYVEIKGHGLVPGAYFVSTIDAKGAVLETGKLVITPR